MSDNGNGHDPTEQAIKEAFEGAHINLEDLKREDGILTRTGPTYQSLLHRVISAIVKNDDYRSELKTALWRSDDEADDAVAAIEECRDLRMDETPIIDQIIARSAGKNHELLAMALRTLSSSTFTVNKQGNQRYDKSRKSDSPIA